jgi:hypothetical protein
LSNLSPVFTGIEKERNRKDIIKVSPYNTGGVYGSHLTFRGLYIPK